MKIAVLMTCFNRKDLTLKCIQMLYEQKTVGLNLDIYLVDDGSDDGTSETVTQLFPQVNIIKGSGSLYWNGGMRLAWETALKVDYDFYLWVNDDSFIYPNAVLNLITSYELLVNKNESVGAILGSMIDPNTRELTYGGRNKSGAFNPLNMGAVLNPEKDPIRCDFVNGNLTLIPKSTVKKIGVLSHDYTHSMGDFDYGLRAQYEGLNCWVAPGVFGECEVNPRKGTWQDKSLPLKERVNKMKSITQLPPLKEWTTFIKRHCGWKWGLLYIDALVRDKFPKTWLLIKGKI